MMFSCLLKPVLILLVSPNMGGPFLTGPTPVLAASWLQRTWYNVLGAAADLGGACASRGKSLPCLNRPKPAKKPINRNYRCPRTEHPCRDGRGCCSDFARSSQCDPDFPQECCDSACTSVNGKYQCTKAWHGSEYTGFKCVGEEAARKDLLIKKRWQAKNEGRRIMDQILDSEDMSWAEKEAKRQMADEKRTNDPASDADKYWNK